MNSFRIAVRWPLLMAACVTLMGASLTPLLADDMRKPVAASPALSSEGAPFTFESLGEALDDMGFDTTPDPDGTSYVIRTDAGGVNVVMSVAFSRSKKILWLQAGFACWKQNLPDSELLAQLLERNLTNEIGQFRVRKYDDGARRLELACHMDSTVSRSYLRQRIQWMIGDLVNTKQLWLNPFPAAGVATK